jgi:hypothetical protein
LGNSLPLEIDVFFSLYFTQLGYSHGSKPFFARSILMATVEANQGTVLIGIAAGDVWEVLDRNGPQTLTKLVKAVGKPRDTVMQAIGWLAREEKIVIEEDGRSRVVALR